MVYLGHSINTINLYEYFFHSTSHINRNYLLPNKEKIQKNFYDKFFD